MASSNTGADGGKVESAVSNTALSDDEAFVHQLYQKKQLSTNATKRGQGTAALGSTYV